MTISQALFLGVLQGLTEFLPVSSSGHLAIAQKLFGLEEPELLFDTFLHIGTLAAVFAALRTDILALLKKPAQKLTVLLLFSTVVTAIFAFTFKKIPSASGVSLLENAFTSTTFLGCAFLFTALILVIAEKLSQRKAAVRNVEEVTWKDALVIGIMQGIGVLPGISRSGATLSGALGRGIERSFAAKFSFLLSIPAVLGALLLQIKDLSSNNPAASPLEWKTIAIGTVSAAIVGFFSVSLMLKLVRSKPLYGFSIWTAALGAGILFDTFVTRRFF